MESSPPANFPSIYRDFVKMFPDEPACAAYLERLRCPLASSVPPAENNENLGEPNEDGWFVLPVGINIPLLPEQFLIKPEPL